ncbi:MAG: hypothetical protein EBR09_12130 [Proteobacteria bacterium]|nr:hypothetical protein [Pseudomonadota bacterium]
MWRLFLKGLANQRGSAMATSMVMASGVAIATVSIISLTRNLRKNRENTEQVSAERRLNEAAMVAVTQLVTNGALYFNPQCSRLQPTIRDGEHSDHVVGGNNDQDETGYQFSSCTEIRRKDGTDDLRCEANPQENWLYSWDNGSGQGQIQVCVPEKQGKKAADATPKFKRVTVSVTGYEMNKEDEEGNRRNFALVKAKPDGRNDRGGFYSSLSGRISLGLTSGNKGLLGKHGAADTCFYMRPLSAKQTGGGGLNLAFRKRTGDGNYTIEELEPRPDGPNADEFQVKTDLGIPDPIEDDYAILNNFRAEKLYPAYNSGWRGNRPATENWGGGHGTFIHDVLDRVKIPDVIRNTFIGVLPNIQNGPQFRYFLYAVPGTAHPVDHRQDRFKFNAAEKEGLLYGCNSTTKRLGTMASGFCTKVEMPLVNYTATFRKKCMQTTKSLPSVPPNTPPTVVTSDRAIMTSCHPDWPRTAERIIAEINKHAHGIHRNDGNDDDDFSAEITATMALSAYEVDDDFLNGTGLWADMKKAQSPAFGQLKQAFRDFGGRFNAVGQSAPDKYTVRHESDVDREYPCNCTTDDKGNTSCQTCVQKGATRNFTIYGLQNAGGAKSETHTSNSCAYFRYHKPEDPKSCSIEYITKDKADWVCRNNDGCFDELTKVRMADGTDRLMTELRKGDVVLNPVLGKPAKVAKLTIGPEKNPLVRVTVSGSVVRVTENHPFMTKRGWVTAKTLKTGDTVLSANRKWESVAKTEQGAAGRIVVNLALEGEGMNADEHYVLADGVVTGDLVIQNMITPRAVKFNGERR